MGRNLVRRIAAGAMLVCTACSSSTPGAPGTAALDSVPYIRGTITAIERNRIRIEEVPADLTGTAKALLRLTDTTRIQLHSGAVASPSDLRVGQGVSAWVTGPIMESYPVQADASAVVIEASPP
jgi:hypothetical protein